LTDFTHQAAAAVLLVIMTLCVQCAGMALLIHWARTRLPRGIATLGPFRGGVLMVRFATLIIVMQFLQVLLWTAFYRWRCLLPTWESCFYFSAATYSTVGYGDVVLPKVWRLLGPVEAVTGVLMSGLSVSGLFAIVTRLVGSETQLSPPPD
jgi:voltage-gated potassium channel